MLGGCGGRIWGRGRWMGRDRGVGMGERSWTLGGKVAMWRRSRGAALDERRQKLVEMILTESGCHRNRSSLTSPHRGWWSSCCGVVRDVGCSLTVVFRGGMMEVFVEIYHCNCRGSVAPHSLGAVETIGQPALSVGLRDLEAGCFARDFASCVDASSCVYP